MLSDLNNFLRKLFILNPLQRKFILIVVDSFLIINSNLIAFFLINNNDLEFFPNFFRITLISFLLGVPIYLFSGQYKGLSKYVGSKFLYFLAGRNLILSICLFVIFTSKVESLILFKYSIIFWLILTSTSGFLRFAIRDFVRKLSVTFNDQKKKVAIYGIGSTSAQIYASLNLSGKYIIKSFIDENDQLWNRRQFDIPIIAPHELINISNDLDLVLIASKFNKQKKRKEFMGLLEKYKLPVLEIPTFDEIARGKRIDESLKPIKIEDFLGRESILPNQELLGKDFEGQNICITGAGGSIGSELCRQLIKLNPRKIVIIENNEANLYHINNQIKSNFVTVKSFLGSCGNAKLLNKIFSDHKIDFVFHAAAYKHVPIVEENIIEGVENNVISTRTLCKIALKNNVKKVVLISTDKAVRPTNVMGASKRLSELIFQKFSNDQESNSQLNNNYGSDTKFSTVRFGNVLGSSGSVIPLFQKQISQGGPITLTDKKIERYFMTIPEAAQLVLRSTSMSKGGELFLLDMGKPIKIYYLAEQMIRLSGLKIKNSDNKDGDIEIKITGLRPGEKLFEELLIGGKSQKTNHPLIFMDPEKCDIPKNLWEKVDELESAIEMRQELKIKKILLEMVPEWRSNQTFD